MRIDARRKDCPLPVMMAAEALAGMEQGVVEVLVDNPEAAQNIRDYAAQNGMTTVQSREAKDWKIQIAKGYVCTPGAAPEKNGTVPLKKTLLIVIGTDSLGKDEGLGKKLMKGLLDTMKVYKQLPHTMFFLNAGVKLTTENEETVSVLKEMVELGVEIYSCGTCLKHYDLEKSLKVGNRGTTSHIVEGLQDFDKVVWV